MSTATGPAYRLKPDTTVDLIVEKLPLVKEPQLVALLQETLNTTSYTYLTQPGVRNTTLKTHLALVEDYLKRYHYTVGEPQGFMSDFYHLEKVASARIVFHYNPSRRETYVRLVDFSPEAVKLFSTLGLTDKYMEYYNSSDEQLSHMLFKEWEELALCWGQVQPHPDTPEPIQLLKPGEVQEYLTVPNFTNRSTVLQWPNISRQLNLVFQSLINLEYATLLPTETLDEIIRRVNEVARYDFKADNREDLPEMQHLDAVVDNVRVKTLKWLTDNPMNP